MSSQSGVPLSDEEVPSGRNRREHRKACAAGSADRRGQPNDRGGRESLNGVATHEDETGTDEADARHDLCGDPGWIEDDFARLEHVREAVLAYKHE